MNRPQFYGSIEGGGTKFICAIGTGAAGIIAESRFPTTAPAETLDKVCSFFAPYIRQGHLKSIGLGSFGPLDLDPASPTFGYITTTPKPNWANIDILGILKTRLDVPICMDMDVVASAIGEATWGASRGDDLSLYLTIGTGIGGSYLQHGTPLRGLVSLEMGHIRLPHDLDLDPFPGSCPFHGDCFEGLASGPAIHRRMGVPAESLADDHPFWELEADYIACSLANYILILPPGRIVLGGGVMHRSFLYPKITDRLYSLLNGYLNHPILNNHLDEYIVPPGLGYRSGVLGGIAMAMKLE